MEVMTIYQRLVLRALVMILRGTWLGGYSKPAMHKLVSDLESELRRADQLE